jgi:ribonuclease E
VTDVGDQHAPAADAVLESHTHQDARPADAQDGEERRDRRSRDRYGRDRRERGERQPREEGVEAPIAAPTGEAAPEQVERTRYPTGFVKEEVESAPAAAAPSVSPVVAAPSKAPLPKVQPFQLPVDELAHVAEGSGLQWVNSDAEKIAAVQAAIAAEPKPVRVPRERPPAIVTDEGPLVLVETKRDLRELKLPFEQGSLPLQ